MSGPVRKLSLDEASSLTAGAAMWASVGIPDAGIASFTMADGPMGVASGNVDERDISLLTPCPTALGASWDRELVRKVGRVVGGDAVARGVDAVLGPNLNLARSPLAGRAFEYFSEDPFLAGCLGAAWITGLQETGTGAVAKHMVCNDSETARDSVDVQVDEATLREVYLLPFELAHEADCRAFLAAYNKVNGAWCSESARVLSDIVKDEWGFDGLIMSDWFGTHSGVDAINAGLDLEMPGPARVMGQKLADAAAHGAVAEGRLQDAAERVARVAQRVTGPKAAPADPSAAEAVLEEAAAAGMVLLRNEGGILPLSPASLTKLAVIGPNAAAPCYQGGTFAKIAVAPGTPSPIEGIRARFGEACEIVFEPGVDPQPRLPAMPVRPARDIGDGCTTGMTIDYFASEDCSGAPLTSETRDTNSLVWFVGVHDQARFDRAGSVRATGRFSVTQSGAHRFYVGSTGAARLSVNGAEAVRAGGTVDARDVMGVLKRGDAEFADVVLEAGTQVEVEVTFRFVGARVHGLWFGVRSPDSAEAMLARAIDAARSADAVVLIVGETSDSSVESKDRADTKLAEAQLELIRAVTAVNPRTIAVVNVGHAFDAEWGDLCAALLVAWYPGQGFAHALASVLAGDREPGGRMPVSIAQCESDYPAFDLTPAADGSLVYAEGSRIGYRGLIADGRPARHPVGSGEGYARFAWSAARVEGESVHVTVTNTSDRAGAEVVQLYRDAPECALLGFAKVWLGAGEAAQVVIQPDPRLLRHWQPQGWQAMRGPIAVRLARSAEDGGIPLVLMRS
ncbi:glycoside hydrolase family 3 protein [Novosphingobium sp. FKTRR1]|uniref:glycoside hydrolase family 3 protein n=1 Tax=Novosphingobium sp. FKTRR1 TaxID=2879118 RepID=UPI001CF00E35|nr:glycoside hydrolase family 3 C-terminal domain-containing protein [Novosphingobium sp. FKTRR1]